MYNVQYNANYMMKIIIAFQKWNQQVTLYPCFKKIVNYLKVSKYFVINVLRTIFSCNMYLQKLFTPNNKKNKNANQY